MKIKISAPLIIISVSLIAYMIYVYSLGIDKVIETFKMISLTSLMLLALSIFVAIFFHGLAWHLILLGGGVDRQKVRFREVFGIVSIALLSGYIIPVGAVTELMRLVLTNKRLGLESSKTISTIMIHRIYVSSSAFLMIFILLIARYIVLGKLNISFTELVIIIIYTLLVIIPNIGLTGFLGTGLFRKILGKIKSFLEEKYYKEKILFDPSYFVYEYKNSIKNIFLSKYSLLSFLASAGEWLFLTTSMYILINSFMYGIGLLNAFIIALFIQLIYWIMPVSVSGLAGFMEFIITLALQVLGISPYIAVSFAVTYRIVTFLVLLIVSYPMMKILRIEDLRDLLRSSEKNS
ncbi:MAG: flippase-like domain-containing protein [Desulfurococcales archaeon]|nr:flippase-like domain-containing protein [Desulfurococcales archaeon]